MLLFTYGTLRRGESRHRHIRDQRFLGEYRTEPLYVLIPGPDYPCLRLPRDGETPASVPGELYEIDEALLPLLDQVEGSPWLFKLEPIRVHGLDRPVFAYFFQQ